jgi:4-carboxymuconolactone decarboxylase
VSGEAAAGWGLSAGRSALVGVGAALASRDGDVLGAALKRAARDADATAVEEVILQSYLFLGYPAALNAFALWRSLTGIEAPEPTVDREVWAERGAHVCQAVYAGQYEGLRANVRGLHPDMERWMVEEGYGKVLGRGGLDLPTRELCIVALLAVLDVPRQLYAHMRGALNVGASAAEVAAVLEVALPLCSASAAERARETWTSVRERAAPRTGGSATSA